MEEGGLNPAKVHVPIPRKAGLSFRLNSTEPKKGTVEGPKVDSTLRETTSDSFSNNDERCAASILLLCET